MINVASLENMKKSDLKACSLSSSKELMFNAGSKCTEVILKRYPYLKSVGIVCGKGNNGGDGFVIASLLKKHNIDVNIYLIEETFSESGKYYFDEAIKEGCNCSLIHNLKEFNEDLIIDCIFGIGFKGEVNNLVARVIDLINSSNKDVVSIDINSGLNAENGMGNNIIHSSLTIAINNYKAGHFLNMAKDYIHELEVVDIGIDLIDEPYYLIEDKDLINMFPKRKNFTTKRDYGYVGLIGGSINYSGALRLSSMALASVVSGAGVVKLATIKSLTNNILPNILEATYYPLSEIDNHLLFDEKEIEEFIRNLKVLTIGMGLMDNDETLKLVKYVLDYYDGILILDADALNALSRIDSVSLKKSKAKIILTPHLYEFSRLSHKEVNEILSSPINAVKNYCLENNVIVLLKGSTTIVSDGNKVYLINRGTPGMAKGGSGDVLSGLLTGICCLDEEIVTKVAKAAYINGLAGERASKQRSEVTMTPRDTVKNIKAIIENILK